MSRQIQIRRGNAAENDAFTGAIGEVTMDTTNNTLRVHDGTTAGGTKLAKQSEIPTIPEIPTVPPCVPSDEYDTITPTGSGMLYTAPENGWVTARARSTSSSGYVFLTNESNGINSGYNTYNSNYVIICNIQLKKGQDAKISYGNINFEHLRFVYAE